MSSGSLMLTVRDIEHSVVLKAKEVSPDHLVPYTQDGNVYTGFSVADRPDVLTRIIEVLR